MSGVPSSDLAPAHTRGGWPEDLGSLALRLVWLYGGLTGFGVSLALMVRARLGLDPWDVLHQGIARQLGVPIGWVIIAASALVLVAWIPLRQRPGFGTLSNVVVVGLIVNAALRLIPSPGPLALRMVMLVRPSLSTGPPPHVTSLRASAPEPETDS